MVISDKNDYIELIFGFIADKMTLVRIYYHINHPFEENE